MVFGSDPAGLLPTRLFPDVLARTCRPGNEYWLSVVPFEGTEP